MWTDVASSVASSQSARQGSSAAGRPKKDLKVDKDTVEAEPAFEVPQEMQLMLQTFSRE